MMQRRLRILMDEERKISPDHKTNWVWSLYDDENVEEVVDYAIGNGRDTLVLQPVEEL